MRYFNRYWAAPLLLALTGCPSTKSDKSTPSADVSSAATAATADFRRPGYVMYRGQLAGTADSVTLHLTSPPAHPGSSTVGDIVGSYYGADGEPHEARQLSTKVPAADSLLLVYYNMAALDGDGNPQENLWRLRRQPDGRLVGTVSGRAVQLRPVRPTLALSGQTFADSVALFPGRARSPYGHVGMQTLIPASRGGVATAVGANIRRLLRGDTLPDRPVPELARLWQQQRAEFARYYRTDAAEMAADSPDSAEMDENGVSLRFTSQSTMSVLCQEGNLLSVSCLNYEYSGGVHGNFGSTVRSFDLRTGRALFFDDIFRPDARARLLPLLEQGVRRTLGIGDNEPLDSQLLSNQMRLTTNVCLVPGGVLFSYSPYEIAAYALGEVRVFVPLAAVRPLLRAGLPLPGAAAGVARR